MGLTATDSGLSRPVRVPLVEMAGLPATQAPVPEGPLAVSVVMQLRKVSVPTFAPASVAVKAAMVTAVASPGSTQDVQASGVQAQSEEVS